MENYENNRDNIVKGENLIFEYYSHDDNGEVEQVHRAINNLDINVNKGEFVAVLGHNGSGKSTLAKHLNALLMPTKGTLWIKGMKTSNKEKIWDIRQSAGMVFQNPDNQIIATIVEEDVAFGPENLGIEPYNIRKRVKEALNNVGMTSYSKHSPNKLSGGQKQRIAIAGVLAMKPECIILDEPTAMLEPSGREEVMNTIMKLNREDGITIILITHYMEEAIEADRVIVMEEGEIALQGKPKEVFSKVDKMKQLGLDVPQVTEVTYLLRKSGLNIKEDILNIEEMVDAICQLKLEN
jgi:energy-coupling factor transporter ATPase